MPGPSPEGTIAAAIVAGIYGHKAVEKLDDIKNDQDNIDRLTADLAADAEHDQCDQSRDLRHHRHLHGARGRIAGGAKDPGHLAGDLDYIASIASLINTDIRQVPPIIMNLGVSEATTAWYKVAGRRRTPIAPTPISRPPAAPPPAWNRKLRTLIASPTKKKKAA